MQCKFSVFVFNLPRTAVAATIQNQEVTFTYCKNNTRHCQFCFHRTESINESQNCTKPFCSSQYRECTVHFFLSSLTAKSDRHRFHVQNTTRTNLNNEYKTAIQLIYVHFHFLCCIWLSRTRTDGYAFSQEEGGAVTQTDVIRAYDTNIPKPDGKWNITTSFREYVDAITSESFAIHSSSDDASNFDTVQLHHYRPIIEVVSDAVPTFTTTITTSNSHGESDSFNQDNGDFKLLYI